MPSNAGSAGDAWYHDKRNAKQIKKTRAKAKKRKGFVYVRTTSGKVVGGKRGF